MNRPDDKEAAMARADLYKLANYSMKLFKMIHDGDQLEGWVQAKITKSADYVASVYHYLEYEMKFSSYGDKIENSDMYSESVRKEFRKKLTEAKVKLEKLKEKNQKDLDEAFDDKAKVGDSYKTSKGSTVTKTATGIKHERDPKSYSDEDGDEKSGKGKKSHAKSQSAAEKKAQAPKQKQSPKSAKTWGMKDGEKFDNRDKEVKEAQKTMSRAAKGHEKYGKEGMQALAKAGKDGKSLDPIRKKYDKYDEAAKPDFLDMDKDGNKKEPMKKAVKDKNDARGSFQKQMGGSAKDLTKGLSIGAKKGVNPFAKK